MKQDRYLERSAELPHPIDTRWCASVFGNCRLQ